VVGVYDRSAGDALNVQSEVADQIAHALAIRLLTGKERSRRIRRARKLSTPILEADIYGTRAARKTSAEALSIFRKP